MRVVFVHGAGSAGAAAWPTQAAECERDHSDWKFLARADAGDDAERDALRVLEHLRFGGGGHVVAHSYGANAALLAAESEPESVRTLTLLEPACFDLARGIPAVEKHIVAMTPVFEAARDPSVSAREFLRLFALGMGFDPPDLPEDELEARVGRLRTLRPPWGLGLERLAAPTFVLTGRWNSSTRRPLGR